MDRPPSPPDDIPAEWQERLPAGTIARIRGHLAAGGRRREAWLIRLGLAPESPIVSPPAPASWPAPAVASGLLGVVACDYRIPLNRLRYEGSEGYSEAGCGCSAVCLAGRSQKKDGLVGRECWGCEHSGLVH